MLRLFDNPITRKDNPITKPKGLPGDSLDSYAGFTESSLLSDAIQNAMLVVASGRPISTDSISTFDANRPPREFSGPHVIRELILAELQLTMVGKSVNWLSKYLQSENTTVVQIRGAANLTGEASAVLAKRSAIKPKSADSEEILVQATSAPVFFVAALGLQESRHPYTLALMDILIAASRVPIYQLKHTVGCPRPADVLPEIVPIVMAPAHGSWPSGHATQSYLLSNVLYALFERDASAGTELERREKESFNAAIQARLAALADRIAENREKAGVHYPMDSAAGKSLGKDLAEAAIALASAKSGFFSYVGPEFKLLWTEARAECKGD